MTAVKAVKEIIFITPKMASKYRQMDVMVSITMKDFAWASFIAIISLSSSISARLDSSFVMFLERTETAPAIINNSPKSPIPNGKISSLINVPVCMFRSNTARRAPRVMSVVPARNRRRSLFCLFQ